MEEDTHPPEEPANREDEPDQELPAPQPPAPPARLRRVDVVVLLAITLLTGIVHFARLANPDRPLPLTDEQCTKFPRLVDECHEMIPLDEWHYVPDARDVLLYGTESDRRVPPDDGAFVVHPPFGKWGIALGIKIFGDAGFGWRFSGALLGSLAVAVLYLFAWRLWGSTLLAGTAAALLGIEGLWFVMSRVAMLDIYAAFFILTGAWLLVEDRERTLTPRGPRWWRIGAGLAFGLAFASKWSTIPFFMAALALAIWWEFRHAPPRPWIRRRFTARENLAGSRVASLAGALVVLPFVVYLATYLPWFFDAHRYDPPRCDGKMEASWYSEREPAQTLTGWVSNMGRFGQWICYQREMADFHRNLEKFEEVDTKRPPSPVERDATETAKVGKRKPAHPYFGNGYAWPWTGRPVAHYYEEFGTESNERIKHIVGLPNPVIWVTGFLAIPFLLWWAIKRRDAIATLVIVFLAVGWLPVLYADIIDRPVFLFYATPMIPFLVLGVVHVLSRVRTRFLDGGLVVIGTYLALAALAFTFFYPVLAGYPIPRDGMLGWSRHMWLNDPGDCAAQDAIKNSCWI